MTVANIAAANVIVTMVDPTHVPTNSLFEFHSTRRPNQHRTKNGAFLEEAIQKTPFNAKKEKKKAEAYFYISNKNPSNIIRL